MHYRRAYRLASWPGALVLAAAAATAGGGPASAARQWPGAGYPHSLRAGSSLLPGQQLRSPRGTFRLVMQPDGNLAEYELAQLIWSTSTSGRGARATMRASGNLVVSGRDGTPLWQSGPGRRPGPFELDLRRGGNLVIEAAGEPVWSRRSSLSAGSPDDSLLPGASMTSPNGGYQLTMQPDGDLVETTAGTALWSTATSGDGNEARLQADGNFVVSTSQGTTAWQSGTGGHTGGFVLDLRNNGSLIIFSAGLGTLWSRTSGGHVVLGAWPGATGPRQAAAQYGYPYASPPACTDGGACVADQWLFYRGQCTSWLAYRLNQLNGFAFSNYYGGQGRWGNADNWGPQARRLGIAVNTTPALGSIAWYSSGHVAYVEQVNSPTSIVISEMNYDGDNGFRIQSITPASGYWPTGFIHIRDR